MPAHQYGRGRHCGRRRKASREENPRKIDVGEATSAMGSPAQAGEFRPPRIVALGKDALTHSFSPPT
jgi:hypothetical protein